MSRRFNPGKIDWRSVLRPHFSFWRGRAARKPAAAAEDRTAAEVRARLASALPKFERICVSGGDKLEALCSGSAQLVAECETLLKVASGRDDGESLARETLHILTGPLAYIDFCQERHEGLLELLAGCERKTLSMIAVRESMRATLAPLTYMTVLFKIESATLSEEFRETFHTVTTEIDRMRQLVDETFAKNAALLGDTHATIARVRADLERDFRTHFSHIRERRRQIDEAINLLDTELAENNQHDIQLHRQSRSIAGEVARIVEGLQFQDIVQQKCDHVLSALATWSDAAPTQNAVRLQALQLEASASDLSAGHSSVSAGLDRIVVSVDQLDKHSQQLDELQGMTAAADGMVQRLLDAISEVFEMIRGLSVTTEQTHEAIRPAGDLANSLSSTLVELSTNMRLIALNAQIRSVQIGDLTGLETLASRTASISHEIDGVSEESSRALAALRSDLDAMLSTFEEFRSRGREQIAALSQSRVGTESRLHAMRDRAIQSVQKIAVFVADLKTRAQDFNASLSALPALQSEIAAAGQSLNELSARTAPATDTDLAAHAQRYTMATERATHAALMGETAAPADDVAPELFDAPSTPVFSAVGSTPPIPAPAALETPASSADKPEKKSSASLTSPAPAPAPAPDPAPNLGANVELF